MSRENQPPVRRWRTAPAPVTLGTRLSLSPCPLGSRGSPGLAVLRSPGMSCPVCCQVLPSWLAGAPLLSSLVLKARGTNVSTELADIQRGFPGEG